MTKDRIHSLDQFRGYTVAGMFVVNFIGGFKVVPAMLKHHNTYCSYADTIMPQFFFAVGFALRLSYLNRKTNLGASAAIAYAIKRNLGLILLGLVWHHLDGKYQTWEEFRASPLVEIIGKAFERNPFQTLTLIGITSLWILPVLGTSPRIRWIYLALSCVIHLIASNFFYFDWAWNRPVIDGGPLGFLTWTVPILTGTLAFDILRARGSKSISTLAIWSLGFMAAGVLLSGLGSRISWPFVETTAKPDLWTMSQRTGSATYLIFSTGFALLILSLFILICDMGNRRSRLFDLLGRNALAGYLIHSTVAAPIKAYTPSDAPSWYLATSFFLYFTITCLFVKHIDEKGFRI